jgi:hypothetical protein
MTRLVFPRDDVPDDIPQRVERYAADLLDMEQAGSLLQARYLALTMLDKRISRDEFCIRMVVGRRAGANLNPVDVDDPVFGALVEIMREAWLLVEPLGGHA